MGERRDSWSEWVLGAKRQICGADWVPFARRGEKRRPSSPHSKKNVRPLRGKRFEGEMQLISTYLMDSGLVEEEESTIFAHLSLPKSARFSFDRQSGLQRKLVCLHAISPENAQKSAKFETTLSNIHLSIFTGGPCLASASFAKQVRNFLFFGRRFSLIWLRSWPRSAPVSNKG
ncbi:MAG TPA: hypothetical protein VEZ90_12070 [Blastocatellia bacterium]|nr:hypothetical protein [Blastocatellia bacterium]